VTVIDLYQSELPRGRRLATDGQRKQQGSRPAGATTPSQPGSYTVRWRLGARKTRRSTQALALDPAASVAPVVQVSRLLPRAMRRDRVGPVEWLRHPCCATWCAAASSGISAPRNLKRCAPRRSPNAGLSRHGLTRLKAERPRARSQRRAGTARVVRRGLTECCNVDINAMIHSSCRAIRSRTQCSTAAPRVSPEPRTTQGNPDEALLRRDIEIPKKFVRLQDI
jgi:hypothetical protein